MTKVRMRGWISFALVVFVAITTSEYGLAQVAATISGKVEDGSGAAVGGANVTVKSVETGASRTVSTDETGNYRVLSLPLGAHEVRAEKAGFRAAVRTGINLVVGQEAVVNLKLDVGQVTQEINVAADTPLVDTTTANVTGFVGERQIKELPLNGRSFDNLITLNPGAINYTYKSPGTVTSQGNTFSVAGRRPLENIFLLNGIEYTGSSQLSVTPGGVSGYLLGIDAVREFNVLSGTYSAEYGKRAGAQVTAVTQSGTNQFHGTVFEFLRNSALDARTIFDLNPNSSAKSEAAPFRRNQFGGSIGGPIKQDRLFFFGNYEGFRHRLAITNPAVVPDQQVRQGLIPNAATGVYSAPANARPEMMQYFRLWPEPNGPEIMVPSSAPPAGCPSPCLVPSGSAYSYNSPKQEINEDFGTMKGDYNFRNNDSLSVSYTIDNGNNLSPLADPLFGNYITLRSHVASIRHTHIFSPNVLNTFTGGFSRAGFRLDPYSFANFPRQSCVCDRPGSRRNNHRRNHYHNGCGRDHFSRTEQCRGRAEPAKSLHVYGWTANQPRHTSDRCGRVVSKTSRQREHGIATNRRRHFREHDDVSARNRDQLPGRAKSHLAGFPQLVWRVVRRRLDETQAQSHTARRHSA